MQIVSYLMQRLKFNVKTLRFREDDIANELEELSMEANKGREGEIDQNGVDEPVVTKKEKVSLCLF